MSSMTATDFFDLLNRDTLGAQCTEHGTDTYEVEPPDGAPEVVSAVQKCRVCDRVVDAR